MLVVWVPDCGRQAMFRREVWDEIRIRCGSALRGAAEERFEAANRSGDGAAKESVDHGGCVGSRQ